MKKPPFPQFPPFTIEPQMSRFPVAQRSRRSRRRILLERLRRALADPDLGLGHSFVIRHSSLVILTLLTLLTLPTLLTGCTILAYKSPTGEHFIRTSVGGKTSISHLTVESRTNGVHKVDLRGYKDDTTEALGAMTEAAVRAAIGAAK